MRRETAEALTALNVLVHDDDGPQFRGDDLIVASKCEKLRRDAFGSVKSEANDFAVQRSSFEEFEMQKAVTQRWNAKLAALLTDANAEI
jgi:hypothetical protein